MNEYELKYDNYENIAGVDEVGRGCIFGPVVSAAVILPKGFDFSGINDSKKLSEKKRILLNEKIMNEALSYAIVEIDSDVIDEINILEASKLAMIKAIQKLDVQPDVVLIDALDLKISTIHESIIKGDEVSYSIAAASIIAKVYRDDLMVEMAKDFPGYDIENNKGYPTPKHKLALNELGATKYHRKSFSPVKELIGNE